MFDAESGYFSEFDRSAIALPLLDAGKIYVATNISSTTDGHWRNFTLAVPSTAQLTQYTDRDTVVYTSMDDYRDLIVPALLLGCRVREYEQRCASVISMQRDELVLSVPAQKRQKWLIRNQGGKGARFEDRKCLTLTASSGESFTANIKYMNVKEGEKRWRVVCETPHSIPREVDRNALLEIRTLRSQQAEVTSALLTAHLEHVMPSEGKEQSVRTARSSSAVHAFTKASEPRNWKHHLISRAWPTLLYIYGEKGRYFYPATSLKTVTVRRKNGDLVRLNQEQSEAVNRYNSDACIGFVVESPPGSGKTMTAEAMAVTREVESNYSSRPATFQ